MMPQPGKKPASGPSTRPVKRRNRPQTHIEPAPAPHTAWLTRRKYKTSYEQDGFTIIEDHNDLYIFGRLYSCSCREVARAAAPVKPSDRELCLALDGWECAYCGFDGDRARLRVDRIIPEGRNGNSELANLVTACEDCLKLKQDFTPEEAGLLLAHGRFYLMPAKELTMLLWFWNSFRHCTPEKVIRSAYQRGATLYTIALTLLRFKHGLLNRDGTIEFLEIAYKPEDLLEDLIYLRIVVDTSEEEPCRCWAVNAGIDCVELPQNGQISLDFPTRQTLKLRHKKFRSFSPALG